MRFTWNAKKAKSNLRKHKVSFDEATTVFADPLAIDSTDDEHPERRILIGLSERQGLLLTVFVEMAGDLIRLISARRATSHERRHYEEGE